MKVESSRVLLLYLPNKSRADLDQISGHLHVPLAKESIKIRNSSDINDHCVLWYLFICSQKHFAFMKGADKIFVVSSLILVSQWSYSSFLLCDQNASLSLPAVPVARRAGRVCLNALMNMRTQSEWHEKYAFWSYYGLVSQVMAWPGREGSDDNELSFKYALGHGQSTSAKAELLWFRSSMICSLNSHNNSKTVLLTGRLVIIY